MFPMPLFRFTMRWNGFSGAPGYTNLYLLNPEVPTQAVLDAAGVRIRNFLATLGTSMPAGVSITFPNEVDQFNTTTGELEGTLPTASQNAVTGVPSGNYSSAVGMCVNWTTTQIVGGRRLRGRTFLVPLAAAAYGPDGTLSDTVRTTVLTAANTFISEQNNLVMAIWAKPNPSRPEGVSAQVTSVSINDKTAVLRSRRD